MTAKPRIKCNDCGGATKRLLGTGSGIIFKGSGFYETDYKTKRGEKPKSESKGKDKAPAKTEKKSGDTGSSSKSAKPGKSTSSA
jgi:hypothetical protein